MSSLPSSTTSCHGNTAVIRGDFKSHPSPLEDPGIGYEHETSFEGCPDGLEQIQPDKGRLEITGELNLDQLPTFETVGQNHALSNTQHLYSIRLRKPCTSACCSCCEDLHPDLCEVPSPIKTQGVSKEAYKEALKHVLKSTKISQYTLWYNRFLQTLLYSVLFTSIWGVSLVLLWKHGLHPELGLTLFGISSVGALLFCYVSCSCFRRRLNYTAKCALSKCNAELMRHHILATTIEEGAVGCYAIHLHFAYYNPGQCMDRLVQVLNCALVRKVKRKKKTWCSRLLSLCSFPCLRSTPSAAHIKHSVIEETDFMLCDENISQTRIQEFALTLMHHYSHRYLTGLILNSLRKPFYSRHVPEKLCLCQFIEREFFHLPLDSINTITV